MGSELDDKIDHLTRNLAEALEILGGMRGAARPPHVNPFKRLVFKETWPKAVPDHLFADRHSDHERHRRAAAALDQTLERQVAGKKFLDARCGSGDVPHAAAALSPRLSVGYDHARQGWDRFPPDPLLKLTRDWSEVTALGPYDAVVVSDLLGSDDDPVSSLRGAAGVLSDAGLLYVRIRPWTSRVGPDPRRLNKAFAHLFLSDADLLSLGVEALPRCREFRREAYREWFARASLRVRGERRASHPVEPLFGTPALRPKLAEYTTDPDTLSVTFLDYTLEKE